MTHDESLHLADAKLSDKETMEGMHDVVKKSLNDSTEWTFKYIAAGNNKTTAGVFKLTEPKKHC